MRHRVFGRGLGRTKNQRKALFKNLVVSLVANGRVKTTEAKAKAVRPLVEKLITKAKEGSLHSRRQVAKIIHDKKMLSKLVDEIAPGFVSRHGGFTRILRLGQRKGDQSMMVELSLLDKDKDKEKGAKKSKNRVEK